MNSRERVVSSINHKKTDRVPYDFRAEYTTLERIYHTVGHRDLNKLLKDLGVDIRYIDAIMPEEKKCGTFYQNFWGERFVYKQTEWGPVREDIPGALNNARSINDLINFDWPTTRIFDYSNIRPLCNANNDYALVYGFADIWQRPSLVRGMENALMDMILNPDWVHFLARKFTDFYIEDYSKAFMESGERIDIFLVISDLGGQNGPIISLAMFNEFIAPYLKELADHIHNLGAYVMFHSCGMINMFIERLIEIGIDILDPIQPVADAMNPENLLKYYGSRICFHGGIDVQNLLPFGTPEDVEEEVRHYSKILGEKGGYICCPAHLFQPDIPPENIFAFYKALVLS